MIKNYLKIAYRNLWKNKVTSFINITGLAIGMTASILILLWVQNELNFDRFHADADKIYRLTTNIKANNWIWENTPLLLANAAKKEIPEIEETARLYADNQPVFNINNKLAYEKSCAYVDGSWFKLFHYDVLAGNVASFGQNPYSILISATVAKKYFGNRSAIGSSIRIDSLDYQIKAVVSDAPANSSFQYGVFIPLAALLKDKQRRENDEQWQNANYVTFIKLKPFSNVSSVTKKLTAVLQEKSNDTEHSSSISVIALKDMHFENDLQSSAFIHGNHTTVYVFSILAFLLVVVACINYVNLTTANVSLRAKEVSVKKIVGAKRSQLFYQFITESLIISFIALVTTLILIQLFLPVFMTVTGKNFELPFTSVAIWKVIGATLLFALLLNSIYPALLLSSLNPLNAFRGATLLKVKDSYFRKCLVVIQFTISIILIAGTIIIYRQMQFIQHVDLGYNRSQVLSFPVPIGIYGDKKTALMELIKQELKAESSIENITLANQPIINMGSISTGSADWDGHDTTYNPKIRQLSADADFQKTMQIKMKAGRWFETGNKADKNNVILNETAVAELNIHKPVIEQRFTFKGKTGQIIGIVKDFKYQSLHEKMGPLIAFNDPKWFSFFMLRVAPHNASKAISAVQKIWKNSFPDKPLEYQFLDDGFDDLYKEDQQTSFLITVFAVIAVFISSLGLFGLAIFTAEQRVKEIGIRKVLGASVVQITALLSKDFVVLVVLAILVASPIAYFAMQKWLEGFAYRIPIQWWMFALAGLLAIVLALITISFQAIKAALANPVKSLRSE